MKRIVFLVVAIAAILGFGLWYFTPPEVQKVETQTIQPTVPQVAKSVAKPVVVKIKEKYTEEAKKGDSITRLARKAITQYMKDSGKKLTKEQRVYAEDFIAKTLKNVNLKPGDKIELPGTVLDEVTTASISIDTKNLTKYVKMIKWET